jgi:hypothetical protein
MTPTLSGTRNRRGFATAVGLLAIALAVPGSSAGAQSTDSVSAEDTKFLITPFAAPGYTPEQGGLLTVGALMSFRTSPLFKKESK